jgi:phosphinothricin acetyltransferase
MLLIMTASIAQSVKIEYILSMIRPVSPADKAAICAIYNYYVENTTISFEETPVQINEMEERIRKICAAFPFLVLEDEAGRIDGFAYINTWKERSAYRYSAELSIYVRDGFHGRGIGRRLMEKLLEEARKTQLHSLVSGIALPNDRSIALHEKFGFKNIACFREIGRKFSEWLDVGYWELILN